MLLRIISFKNLPEFHCFQNSPSLVSTVGSNALLLTAPTGATPNIEYSLTMAVSTSTGDQEPCLLSIDCMTCTDSLACADADVTLEENVISNHNLTRYGTNLEYHCDLGREFQINATLFSPTVSLECQWDKTWNPSENIVLPPCECKLSLMLQFCS